jgi:GcrA cell cycle regulator
MPKRAAVSSAACARPAAKMVSRKKAMKRPKELSKRQLYAILAEAVRNTG